MKMLMIEGDYKEGKTIICLYLYSLLLICFNTEQRLRSHRRNKILSMYHYQTKNLHRGKGIFERIPS